MPLRAAMSHTTCCPRRSIAPFGFQQAERGVDLRAAGADEKGKFALRDRQRKGDFFGFSGRIFLADGGEEKAREPGFDRVQGDGFELLVGVAKPAGEEAHGRFADGGRAIQANAGTPLSRASASRLC